MSVAKLLRRIVPPELVIVDASQKSDGHIGLEMNDHTFGIASDPLAQFACVFSALIHNVGHPGVPWRGLALFACFFTDDGKVVLESMLDASGLLNGKTAMIVGLFVMDLRLQ
jgi:hypothetical protein